MGNLQGWLTFAAMIIIQVIAAAAVISRIDYITKEHSAEIDKLRDWRKSFGQKELIYDEYGQRIDRLEERIYRHSK